MLLGTAARQSPVHELSSLLGLADAVWIWGHDASTLRSAEALSKGHSASAAPPVCAAIPSAAVGLPLDSPPLMSAHLVHTSVHADTGSAAGHDGRLLYLDVRVLSEVLLPPSPA